MYIGSQRIHVFCGSNYLVLSSKLLFIFATNIAE